jgi:hypothetical protein
MSTSIIITQSNYIPWKGYFDNIAQVDKFVLFDSMQYTKRDWRNRNKIKTKSGTKWLTIPVEVKGKFNQAIKDTKIADKNWSIKHWDILKSHYSNCPHFKHNEEWVKELYKNCINFNYLGETNLHFIKGIMNFFGIKTEIILDSEFDLAYEKTDRLIKICKELGARIYYTGLAAKNYIEEEKFSDENIQLKYFDINGYREYSQLHPPFIHRVTVFDLIFNEGLNSKNFLKILKSK